MLSESRWRRLRERLESLDADAVLVTPGEDRPFVAERTDEDRVVVSFRDGGERTLDRDQFDVLADSVLDDELSLADLAPGVGPYVTILSLAPGFAVDESRAVLRATDEDDTKSPFVRSRWTVRRPPEEVHDDALLLADFLERHDATDLDGLAVEELVDLYVLLSDVQWGADELRRDVGDELLDHAGPEGRIHGQYGTVTRTRRERRQARDDEEVFAALDEAGVPREWVLGVDEDKLDVVVTATEVDEADVYDVHEQYYVQKTGVEGDAKRSHLQGLKDRLASLEDEAAAEIHDDIDALEDRIDDVLAAG